MSEEFENEISVYLYTLHMEDSLLFMLHIW